MRPARFVLTPGLRKAALCLVVRIWERALPADRSRAGTTAYAAQKAGSAIGTSAGKGLVSRNYQAVKWGGESSRKERGLASLAFHEFGGAPTATRALRVSYINGGPASCHLTEGPCRGAFTSILTHQPHTHIPGPDLGGGGLRSISAASNTPPTYARRAGCKVNSAISRWWCIASSATYDSSWSVSRSSLSIQLGGGTTSGATRLKASSRSCRSRCAAFGSAGNSLKGCRPSRISDSLRR